MDISIWLLFSLHFFLFIFKWAWILYRYYNSFQIISFLFYFLLILNEFEKIDTYTLVLHNRFILTWFCLFVIWLAIFQRLEIINWDLEFILAYVECNKYYSFTHNTASRMQISFGLLPVMAKILSEWHHHFAFSFSLIGSYHAHYMHKPSACSIISYCFRIACPIDCFNQTN